MNTNLIPWAAGLLEGEGSFSLNVGKIRIQCQMTDLDVLEKLRDVLGGGSIIPVKKRKSHWKDCWLYSTKGSSHTKEVILAIRPYMGFRRTARIDELLSAYARTEGRLNARFVRRAAIINAVNSGKTHEAVAIEFGVKRSTISHTMRRHA
ncbi:MAG: hypothetical protein EOP83_08655 [Verrucomicrobiaceae bacterium]|nr:MAG: hypothetical protein EOP83_08655 [Verrucomicrobiaceae bacterium]